MNPCFLCAPKEDWIYRLDDEFYGMLALGPIVEGYSIIATRSHYPSMMDLPKEGVSSLIRFTEDVRAVLRRSFGESVITEHGRIAPCVDPARDIREAHCFHAHRLVFPTDVDFGKVFEKHNLDVVEFDSFEECWNKFKWEEEYLYYEYPDGRCRIAPAPLKAIRQFFRYELADALGYPELADWKDFPMSDVIERAQQKL